MRSLLREWREWRYERRRRRVATHLRRIKRERNRLGYTLTDINRRLIRAMPPEERSQWEARREVMKVHLDPLLDEVEEKTGWTYPYGAEPDNAHRYADHRYGTDSEDHVWRLP